MQRSTGRRQALDCLHGLADGSGEGEAGEHAAATTYPTDHIAAPAFIAPPRGPTIAGQGRERQERLFRRRACHLVETAITAARSASRQPATMRFFCTPSFVIPISTTSPGSR